MEKVNYEPIDDKVLIKPKDPETISAGGVYIPDGSQPEATSGTVVAVGPGPRMGAKTELSGDVRWPMKCKVGDTVFYPKFGAHKLEYDGEEFVILQEGDIFLRVPHTAPSVCKEAIKEIMAETQPLSETLHGSKVLGAFEKSIDDENLTSSNG